MIKVITVGRKFTSNALIKFLTCRSKLWHVLVAGISNLIIGIYGATDPLAIFAANPTIALLNLVIHWSSILYWNLNTYGPSSIIFLNLVTVIELITCRPWLDDKRWQIVAVQILLRPILRSLFIITTLLI